MRYIDLHVHSNASDGTLTPREVVALAIEKNLAAIALSDHDTVKGVEEAIQAAKGSNLVVIPATELSCYYQGIEIHILGLFVDYKNPEFLEKLEELEQARQQRNLDMIKKFQEAGISITLEDLQAGNPNSVITRAHFARALVQKGICKDKKTAFDRYVGVGCPYYLPKPQITPEISLPLITRAGGLPILAHPMLYHLGYPQIEELIQYLIPLGLKGVEAYHSSNYTEQSNKLRSLAVKYNLVISGGSDFHGSNKPDIELGTGRGGLRVTEHILNQLLQSLEH
ncbi:MAG: PHP domain-containing protein [Bacteroides sp.]|nr:PHP domain-containing protein [Bacteroides sp.]MCM1550991.1 PHP domain-containing protein [Clostridium sp.]